MGFGSISFGFGSTRGGGGGGGCGVDVSSISVEITSSITGQYTDSELIGASIILPVAINGNVYNSNDWSFDDATGTITFTGGDLEEGDFIEISYTKPCSGGGGECSCGPVLFSHGDWDYPDATGNDISYPAPATPLNDPSGDLTFELNTTNMPKRGDYAILSAKITNNNPSGTFGFSFNGELPAIFVIDQQPEGAYQVTVKIVRADVNNQQNVYIYCNVITPSNSYTFDFSGLITDLSLPLTILPYVWPQGNSAGRIYVDDYDITVFKQP